MTDERKLPWQMISAEYRRANKPWYLTVPEDLLARLRSTPYNFNLLLDGLTDPNQPMGSLGLRGAELRAYPDTSGKVVEVWLRSDVRWFDDQWLRGDLLDANYVLRWMVKRGLTDSEGMSNQILMQLSLHSKTYLFAAMGADLGFQACRHMTLRRSRHIWLLDPAAIDRIVIDPRGKDIGEWRFAAQNGHEISVKAAHEEGYPVPADVLIEISLANVDWERARSELAAVRRHGDRLVEIAAVPWDEDNLATAKRAMGVLLLLRAVLMHLAHLGRAMASSSGRIFAFAARDFVLPSSADDLLQHWPRYALELEPERRLASWYTPTNVAARDLGLWLQELTVELEPSNIEGVSHMMDVLTAHQPLIDLVWSNPLRWLPGVEALGSANDGAWR